jgi:hypothetical protein
LRIPNANICNTPVIYPEYYRPGMCQEYASL